MSDMKPLFEPGTYVSGPEIDRKLSIKERTRSTFVAKHKIGKLRLARTNVRYSADDLNRAVERCALEAAKPPEITGAVATHKPKARCV